MTCDLGAAINYGNLRLTNNEALTLNFYVQWS